MMRFVPPAFLAGPLSLMLFLGGCSQAPPGAKPASQPPPATAAAAPVAVQVAPVQRGALSSRLSYPGDAKAKQRVSLVPKVSGRVMKLHVDVGSVVQAGDVLVELERDALSAQVAQAEGGLAAARANLEGAKAKLAQLKAGPTPEQLAQAEAQVRLAKNQLFAMQAQADAAIGNPLAKYTEAMKEANSGVAWEQIQLAEARLAELKAGPTPEQLAQAEAAVAAAEATVHQAQATLDLARLQLQETIIHAPFAGIVAERLVSPGAVAVPNVPLLTLLSREVEVVVRVDEGQLSTLRVDQEASVTTAAFPGERFAATIANIAPVVDPKSRTVEVRLVPADKASKLRDGMSAEVQIALGGKEKALLVPRRAVLRQDGASIVYVIAGGKAQRREVKTGLADNEQMEILEGLREGEVVAVTKLDQLTDGVEVTLP